MNNVTLPKFLADVSIINSPAPVLINAPEAQGVLWQAVSGRFILDVTGVAHYFVKDGCSVTINPSAKSTTNIVARFLRMSPLAALLYQRGIVAFHAACVANERGAILLAGESGAGKSTLLTALLQRGWKMLADDLSIVDFNAQGKPVVHPSYPEITLWIDTLDKLHVNANTLSCLNVNRREFSYPEQFETQHQPLHAIYWLSCHGRNNCELEKLEGINRFSKIGMLQYNSRIADVLFNRFAFMRSAAAIAGSVSIFHLRRPRNSWSIHELADMVEMTK